MSSWLHCNTSNLQIADLEIDNDVAPIEIGQKNMNLLLIVLEQYVLF